MTTSEVIMALSRVGTITISTDSYMKFKLIGSAYISIEKRVGRLIIDAGRYPVYMLFIDDLSRIGDFWIDDIRILTIHRRPTIIGSQKTSYIYRIYLDYASDKGTMERIEYHE